MIHPTAIISPLAKIGNNVRIGPYSVVGDHVELGDDCVLHSHVVLEGYSKFGIGNEFFPFAALGGKTQDLKYDGEPTSLEVGDYNVFRENTTAHRSTSKDVPTRIGSHNLFLCYSHIAHDCQLGSHIILSNAVGLAGHVEIGDHSIVAGMVGVHQFVRIGKHAMIAGLSRVTKDVPPFMIVEGATHCSVRGVNSVGLQRRGFSEEELRNLKIAYKALFLKKDINLGLSLAKLKESPAAEAPHVNHLIKFIESSQRGILR